MSNLINLYLSHKLTEKKSLSDPEKLNESIKSANIELNPHQVDAAIFAFQSPLSRGAILADEVGLGKTIEAGLVINQIWVEGKNRILILVPASLRTQWQEELLDKFNLSSSILDGPAFKNLQKETQQSNPLFNQNIYIASHNFASGYSIYVKEVPWDLVVIDEAHRMRNVWRKGNKTAKIIREAIKDKPKMLLTATPLQNNLMELFGLTSFIDENYLGTEFSFKTLFVNPVMRQKKYGNLVELKRRLMGTFDNVSKNISGGILTRTLRKQVRGLVSFTNRFNITEDFAPNDDEMELYNSVSEYLRRPVLASTRATQRNMMELVYRKILASSSFAIAGTLEKIVKFLSNRLQTEFEISNDEINIFIENIRSVTETKYNTKLPDIYISKIEVKKEEIETLPGFEDVEATPDKIEEETKESDDLGEDEQFKDTTEKVEEREIDHVFTKEEIFSELSDVLSYFYLASSISVNQKSQALVRGLKKVFEYAKKKNWPQKAVIFTESRRTQDHLEKLLSKAGYNLILFNGSNAGQKAREIYEEWALEFPEVAKKSSKSINLRKALVWKFKDIDKALLITTEAGAEGLNLQFANIVINFDLPWNPQRIEQRIGRCHRYGQKLDVMVINFLNKRNYADQRVYELLREKIKLFGNLFNFTDKVLGTEELTDDGYEVREVALGGLGSGIDFERKVLDIYRKCRTEKEIETGFAQLQLELTEVIEEKVEDAQRKVIQHFDEEIQQKLALRKEQMQIALSKYEADIRRYIFSHFGDNAKSISDSIININNQKYVLGRTDVKDENGGNLPRIHANLDIMNKALSEDRHISGKWEVNFCHPKDKERKLFEEYVGKKGQLIIDLITCKRKTINNQEEVFEKLVTNAIVYDEDGWKLIHDQRANKLFDLDIIKEESGEISLDNRLLNQAKSDVDTKKQEILEENELYLDHELEAIDTFMTESLLRHKLNIEAKENEIKELDRLLIHGGKTMGFYERQQVRDQIDKKQQDLLKVQKKYFQVQSAQFAEKERKVTDLKGKLKMNYVTNRLAEVQFNIVS